MTLQRALTLCHRRYNIVTIYHTITIRMEIYLAMSLQLYIYPLLNYELKDGRISAKFGC